MLSSCVRVWVGVLQNRNTPARNMHTCLHLNISFGLGRVPVSRFDTLPGTTDMRGKFQNTLRFSNHQKPNFNILYVGVVLYLTTSMSSPCVCAFSESEKTLMRGKVKINLLNLRSTALRVREIFLAALFLALGRVPVSRSRLMF
jgi:hypothetical protein